MTTTAEGAQPITLGELIDALEACEQNVSVVFDFVGHRPGYLMSYRGYYDHLAIDPDGDKHVSVVDFLNILRAAIGNVYEGYKGGDFRMSRETPMWVARYGESGSTCVTGVLDAEYQVVIATGYCVDWSGGIERARKVLFDGLGFGNAR